MKLYHTITCHGLAKPILRIFVYQSSIFLLIIFLFIIIYQAVISYD